MTLGTLGSLPRSVKRQARDLLVGEPIALELLVQPLARESELARRARFIPARALQRLAQAALLERACLSVEPALRASGRGQGGREEHRLGPEPRAAPAPPTRHRDGQGTTV